MRQKIVKRKPGQFVRIELDHDKYGFARVLVEPLIAFYDKLYSKIDVNEEDLVETPVIFTLMVMNHAITSGRWPVIGYKELPPSMKIAPRFCKQDLISGKISIYHEVPELAPHYERPAEPDECRELEVAAVWEPEHVEDRLRDHFAGRPNRWVEQLRIRPR